jgi:hypothetical protein
MKKKVYNVYIFSDDVLADGCCFSKVTTTKHDVTTTLIKELARTGRRVVKVTTVVDEVTPGHTPCEVSRQAETFVAEIVYRKGVATLKKTPC